jgi:hypothetical protein
MILIQPKNYISEKFIWRFLFYSRTEALRKYKAMYPQFKTKELLITKIN